MPLITQGANALEMVARYGSIRKAAERMNATPSAVNHQILKLEQEYGQPLFERLPRGMRPTEAGRVLIGQIRRWQQEVIEARDGLDELRSHQSTRLRVGIMECLASGFFPEVFHKLRRRYPGIALQLIVGGTDTILEKMRSDAIDLAITFNTPHDSNVNIVKTVVLPLGIAVPPGHPLAGRRSVAIEDICNENFVATDESLTIGPLCESIIGRSRVPLHRIVITNSIGFLKAMVEGGMGLSLLTLVDVYDEVRRGKLCFVPISGARMSTPLSFSSRDVKGLTEISKAAGEIISAALDELVAVSVRDRHGTASEPLAI